jgi:ferredoxin
VGYFHCRGADFYLQYLKLGYLFSPDHPTAEELARAETFGREIATRVHGGQHPTAPRERVPSLIYRIERLSFNRWLSTWFFSRFFEVNMKKCNVCGLCATGCPVGNIAQNEARYPIWGRNCLLCLACEMECPEEAIISVHSSPAFRISAKYNVRKASQDPSISHVGVTHRRGRTIRTHPSGTL